MAGRYCDTGWLQREGPLIKIGEGVKNKTPEYLEYIKSFGSWQDYESLFEDEQNLSWYKDSDLIGRIAMSIAIPLIMIIIPLIICLSK